MTTFTLTVVVTGADGHTDTGSAQFEVDGPAPAAAKRGFFKRVFRRK